MEHIARHGVTSTECEEAYCNGPVVIEPYPMPSQLREIYRGED